MPISDTKSKASELTMEGRKLYLQYNQVGNQGAKEKFIEAIRIAPKYADAYGWLAYAMQWEAREGWNPYLRPDADSILNLARKGVELDPSNYYMHWCLADILSGRGKFDEALNEFGSALSLYLNPIEDEKFDILVEIADVLAYRGNAKEALRLIEEAKGAKRKQKAYPTWYPWCESFAHFVNKDYKSAVKAIDAMKKLVKDLPNPAILTRAAALERLGRRSDGEVKADIKAIRRNSPNWKPEDIPLMEPLERREDREHWLGSFKQLSCMALNPSPY
jgi:tetratricopeptide (TPR) repeat protein